MIVDIKKFPPFKHKLQPYLHQQREFERSRNWKHYAAFWEMGTGKSKLMVDTMAWLFLKQEIDGVLIVSDKGAYLNWMFNEIPTHMPTGIPTRMAYWSSYSSQKVIAKRLELLKPQDDMLDILCMNVEAFSSDGATQFAEKFLQMHYPLIIVDESTSIKNMKAQRTKSLLHLAKYAEYRRILTGTPITQSPMDLFSQCQFLSPGILGFTSFTAFRSFYAIMVLQQFGGRRPFQQIVDYKNLDHLTERLSRFSSRYLKTECLDLPDKVYETVYVEHTPEQHQMYQSIKRLAVAQLDQGLMTSTNALTTIVKLQQINCGHAKLDSGEVIDLPNNRIDTLISLLENIQGKVIIWCAFQRDVQLIMKAISVAFNSAFAVDYYGETDDADRSTALEQFKNNPKCKWFVGTAATGGKGLTLNEATTTIYYSNTYNLEKRLQSEDRNHRIGQNSKVTYIDLITPNTVDIKILESLKEKKDLAAEVLDNLRQILDPEKFTEIAFP